MSFTDEDLKRLKESVKHMDYSEDVSENLAGWILNSIPFLLARLEAAEDIVSDYECVQISRGCGFWVENPIFKTWKKASGR